MINPWTWLVGKTGAKAAGWIVLIAVIILAWGALVVFGAFNDWRNRSAVTAQAEQTVASGEAINAAASEAVAVVVKRSDTENAIDAATAAAVEDIGNAETSDDVRAAVVAHMCMHNQASRNDPACAVHRSGSR